MCAWFQPRNKRYLGNLENEDQEDLGLLMFTTHSFRYLVVHMEGKELVNNFGQRLLSQEFRFSFFEDSVWLESNVS